MKPKILLVGSGRAGKDTFGPMLARAMKLTFAGTTSKYLSPYVAKKLGVSEEEAYNRRHESNEMRMLWYETGNEIREGDAGLLVKEAFKHGDITGGIRAVEEIQAVKEKGLADLVVWIERDVPVDPTMTFGPGWADLIVTNNGTEAELNRKAERLASLYWKGWDAAVEEGK